MTAATKTFLLGSMLALLVWASYANSLHGPFVFDDWHVISENPSVRGPGDIASFFTDLSTFSLLPGNRDYRPLFLTSMALAWWAGDGETLPFHIASITLHMLNVLLLFVICRVLFRSDSAAPVGDADAGSETAAFFAAALFAVHPLASESVNYISSQSVPLAVCFYLASFYLFLSVYSAPKTLTLAAARWRLGLSCLAYFCALLGKPIAISLPLVLLLWELTFARAQASGQENLLDWTVIRRRVSKHLAYWGVSLVYLAIRYSVFSGPFGGTDPIRPLWDHYLTETKAIVFYYLKLALYPFDLNIDIDYPVASSVFDPWVAGSIVTLIACGLLLWRYRHNCNLVFWALWFPTGLLLTTYLVVLRQVVNEHRVYLSLAGFCALVAYLAWKLYQRVASRRGGGGSAAGSLAAGLLILPIVLLGVFAYETHARNRTWSSDLSIWQDSVAKGGTWRSHLNYALALERRGLADQALAQFRQAVAKTPNAFAHLNLGLALVKRDRIDTGMAHLHTAVRLRPEAPEPHLYLGYGLARSGDTAAAERAYLEALRLRPNYIKGYRFLARLYETRDRWSEARTAYEKLLALDPGQAWVADRLAFLQSANADLTFREAYALQQANRVEAAIEKYEALLELEPDHRQATFNLAYAYMQQQEPAQWRRAVALFERVLQIDPAYTEALHHLASVYWQLEQKQQASAADRRYLESGKHEHLRQRSKQRLDDYRAQNQPTKQ